MAQSFGRGNFPGVESEALDLLESRYVDAIEEGMEVKLVDALEAKQQAQREHREFRLRRYMQLLRAQLAALRGEPARFPTQLAPQEERAVQKWRRSRQFTVLVAVEPEAGSGEDGAGANSVDASGNGTGPGSGGGGVGSSNGSGGSRVVACATLSLMQPEALLPPPFPSSKPFRLYVSNMCVLPSHRRRGLARRLLSQCERVARLWGHTSLWLHVKRSNNSAGALYRSMGFRPVDEGGLRLLPGPLSQLLMCKDLPPLRNGCPVVLSHASATGAGVDAAGGGASGAVKGVSGSSRPGDGVFVWGAVVADQEGGDGA